jgi:hypothetical protein
MSLRNPVRAQFFFIAVSGGRNTLSSNILRANSFFAKFYADLLRCRAANPSFLKDLEIQSGIFFNPDQPNKKTRRNRMSAQWNSPQQHESPPKVQGPSTPLAIGFANVSLRSG